MYRTVAINAMLFAGLLTGWCPAFVHAQAIVPATDGTGTIATPTGNQINITGGAQAGTNLFHSFQQFGLGASQTANFLTAPAIQNVLGRVTGGDPSIINGVLQVTGSANLYLLNPAGIIFGPTASLSLPASFTATTANGIGFGNQWFSAIDTNTYAALTGEPSTLAFTMPQPGAIVNAANLSVSTGRALTLVGGTVISSGSLTAPAGAITVQSVPGTSLVRLSQTGSVLSLEVPIASNSQPNPWVLAVPSLPQLLTGGTLGNATGLTVTPDGQVQLIGSGIRVSAGNVATTRISTASPQSGGAVSLSASGNLTTGTISSRSLQGQGGSIFLQAAGDITTNGLNSTGFFNSGAIDLISTNGAITVEGEIFSGQLFTGTFTSTTGFSSPINLTARGNITVDGPISTSVPPAPTPNFGQAGSVTITSREGAIDLSRSSIDTGNTFGNAGSITLTAQNDIMVSQLRAYRVNNGRVTGLGLAGNITVTSVAGDIRLVQADADSSFGSQAGLLSLAETGTAGNIMLNARTIAGSSGVIEASALGITGNAGRITLNAAVVDLNGVNLFTPSNTGSGGAITVVARDRMTTGAINTSSTRGNGGPVTLDPLGDIQVNFINAQGGTNGVGGNVTIVTEQFFRAIDTFIDQNGSAASISAAGGVRGGSIGIRHAGNGITPFIIGDAAINGAAGAITTGSNNAIAPPQSFPGIYRQGSPSSRIQIITTEPQRLPENYPLPPLKPNFPLPDGRLEEIVLPEEPFTRQHEAAINRSNTPIKTVAQIQAELQAIERATGVKPAVIYAFFVAASIPRVANPEEMLAQPSSIKLTQQTRQYLNLVLVTGRGRIISRRVPQTTRAQVLQVAGKFTRQMKDKYLQPKDYLPNAQQLYQWLVAPLKADLEQQEIENLVFVMDEGLRSLPLAALHNGQTFLIEQYSVGLMPSLSLTDTGYIDIRGSQVLAMGAGQFPAIRGLRSDARLPSVPLEIAAITPTLWRGESFLNKDFTLSQLASRRQRFGIVHLATHADFRPESPRDSYIRLWDDRLSFDELRTVDWNQPPTDLLVLSACRTAIGDPYHELGFAGLSIQTGSRSSLASLFYADDAATFVLMSKFYQQLNQTAIKAEALRRAQVEMLHHQNFDQFTELLTKVQQSGTVIPSSLRGLATRQVSHPYYWSGFTLVGNPW